MPTEAIRQLGLELKSLRVRAGLTQQELVEQSDGKLRLGSVIAIENAKYTVGMGQFIDYLDTLGYEIKITKSNQQ